MDLFSSFEPGTGGMVNNWVALVAGLGGLPLSLFLLPGKGGELLKGGLGGVNTELQAIFGAGSRPGTSAPFVGLFVFIGIMNVTSLLPYVFTPTSHLSVTLSLAAPLWAGHMGYSGWAEPRKLLAHLVPAGTPPFLISPMVVIELISMCIRPMTLAVRLAANLVAGHLLLSLLGGTAGGWGMGGSLGGMFLLLGLEGAVAVIQGYVFSLLSSLYVEEVGPNSIC